MKSIKSLKGIKSIKIKIWAAILSVTILVILCIWISQVILLEEFYLAQKKKDIQSTTQEILRMISSQTSTEDFTEQLKTIAAQNNYCIQISDISGNSMINAVPEGSANILMDENFVRRPILERLLNSNQTYYLEEGLRSSFGTKFYVGAAYHIDRENEYVVMVAATLAPVKEAVSTIRQQLIGITLFLILIATIVAFLMARSLTQPILKISNAAKAIAKGQLDTRVSVKSKDEIGQLADNFNIMAKEISKATTLQRELVANVSHDIRTPLTMIKGYAETIKDLTGDNKEKREKQLDIIIEESNRLNVLVNDILDLSKLQAGQLTLEYSYFDLSKILRDIMKRYDLLVSNENFSFHLDVPESCVVYADEVKIQQVIYNIVNNATNHTGEDKQVFVSLDDYPDRAVVRVQDTGVGIKPEDLPLIWDRYYKPYKKNDRKGMGTGLGLSIVKAILNAHQLQFGVHSVLGQGSTFWFEVKKKSS